MKLTYKIASILAFNAITIVLYQLMLVHFIRLILSH